MTVDMLQTKEISNFEINYIEDKKLFSLRLGKQLQHFEIWKKYIR